MAPACLDQCRQRCIRWQGSVTPQPSPRLPKVTGPFPIRSAVARSGGQPLLTLTSSAAALLGSLFDGRAFTYHALIRLPAADPSGVSRCGGRALSTYSRQIGLLSAPRLDQ